ncbi:non-homologous end joining protein Ku [Jatrophihabitans sp. DSM 45814]
MRSMWKGTVSFGLVSIPVKLYAATEQHDVAFRQVRHSDGSRIRYKRVAEADGEEVAYADISKGYELPDGQIIVIDEQDLADLPLPTKRTVDVLEFVPLSEVDPIYFNKSYYLEPEKNGLKPYALLRDALANSQMVAVVKVAISNREQLATLRVKDNVLVLATMMWPDEIRTPDFAFLKEDIPVRPQELAMADSLIQSMATSFDPTEFHDEFQAALGAMLAAKTDGVAVAGPAPVVASSGNVVDLMASLQASIDKARAEKAGSQPGSASGSESGSALAKATKSAAKKPPAKKAPAKRARKSA